ncbi:DNA polymerase III subunit gamma and tau [Arcanobacterium buesumense]|uniref:DNA polymerase III subunit gamma/tau n=1 Tax=Arcanobacterium buesumense TaxID=2722751 RepID=A0A6H2EN20_9ACTO|nr:DNA polymerase III subunit gamma and tau [Arcanobacterium buesumense]
MSVAMYRRYRPQSFQEVIGQDHVVAPLRAALAAGRTTHAYLFSGPRGCGKTTSARILARCLNCVNYPTDTPCGQCDSCRDLARDGAGSLDVVEMDAASHGGVDDARELREQASFAPVRDRFKIFIIDEAHMVSNQGFNALLKLVEEPPAHVKFIFATTEPEKVIGTIRSRTHHYPFRLVPPLELEKYLARICAQEGVVASKEVLSLVIRAGTGSVRDTLSVLDQIIGGSDSHTLDYDRAVALLGYTSAHLLDDAVSAVSERDGVQLFGVVDSVVKSGHDPRRFVEDLLQRLRDVVIIALTGQSARDVFVSVPDDQYQRMADQATRLGAARASRCADITNDALNMMVGATAPRLQLELLCARLVVAQAEKVGIADTASGASVVEGGQVSTPPQELKKWKKPSAQEAIAARQDIPAVPAVQPQPAPVVAPATHADPPHKDVVPEVPPARPERLPDSAAAQARVAAAGPAQAIFDKVRQSWDEIVAHPHLGALVRNQLKAGARPYDVTDNTLRIAFAMPAVALRFNQRASGTHVADVIKDILHIDLAVTAIAEDEASSPKDKAALDTTTPVVPENTAQPVGDMPHVQPSPEALPEEDAVVPYEPVAEVEYEEENPIDTPTSLVERQDDADPAGVLGALVDGTAKLKGNDHIQVAELPASSASPATVERNAPRVEPIGEVPFFAEPMPAIPPLEYPGEDTSSSAISMTPPAPVPVTEKPRTQPTSSNTPNDEKRPVWEVHPPIRAEEPTEPSPEWEEVSEDDPDISESSLVGLKVLLDTFNAQVIEEIPDRQGGE